MAKQQSKKKTPGTRNANRKNGKAFSKKKFDDKGRALTGRGKPTGRTAKGMKIHCTCPNCQEKMRIDVDVIDLTRCRVAA